jgi:cation diffusion facilitator CzcD-associated flavoprotein CzcO
MTIKSIAIIGTGFSGIGTAIRLKQRGIEDFIIFERAQNVGGTWRDNTYPGCACDIESHLYSFSFALNPQWSRKFSFQPEILNYLHNCVNQFNLRPHIRFQHEVIEATWDEAHQYWRIQTSQGIYTARVLIAGTGALSEPMIPKLPGIDLFQGHIMHSARWDHQYQLKGKKVAVIGTGASSIQFVPEIQLQVDQLYLYQRTAAWVIPRLDRVISKLERQLTSKIPIIQKILRWKTYILREALGLAFRYPWILKMGEILAHYHIKRTISDPILQKKLTPKYRMGCKRILISNNYYPALAKKNVEVITDEIQEIRSHSIVTRDGKERQIDSLILATGFHATDMPIATKIRGRNGTLLSDSWKGGPRSYLGISVPCFPNFFLIMGPNTTLGHTSVVLIIESQIEHILKALHFMATHQVSTLEVKKEAEDQFNLEVDQQMKNTIWSTGGCNSWYQDSTGRISAIWPASIATFRNRVEPFVSSDYALSRFK